MRNMESSNRHEGKHGTRNTTIIPWQDKDQWRQALEAVKTVARRHDQSFTALKEKARRIEKSLQRLTQIMDGLCNATCQECKDICCSHATVWYDLKDLLFIHFSGQDFPSRQISKVKGENDKTVCANLTMKGCCLPREKRPFICTWYVCPPQNRYVNDHCSELKSELGELFDHIKRLRTEIETGFIYAKNSRYNKT